MNYYEELGLAPNSSADQIKEAYRALMRLLHPDHHSEPLLQHVAEQQVKKLNAVYAVLSDPERRRRYDHSLFEDAERATPIIIHAPPPERRKAYVNRNSMAWVAAVSIFAILLIWMASRPTQVAPAYTQDSGATPVEPQPAPSAPTPAPALPAPMPAVVPPSEQLAPSPALVAEAARTKAEMQGLRLLLAQTTKERDNFKQELISFQEATAKSARERAAQDKAALEKAAREKAAFEKAADERAAKEKNDRLLARAQDQRSREQKSQEQKAAVARPAAEPIRQAKIPAAAPVLMAKTEPPPAPPELAPVIHNALAGAWVYRKPAAPPKNKDLYPPEFIETVITEDNGQLRGTYHARYQVPNRPVSPEVAFQFNGRMFGDSGSLPWSGTGGAKGEVTFTLTADHSLRVDWVASQLGSLGFYKGTAVLVKKSD